MFNKLVLISNSRSSKGTFSITAPITIEGATKDDGSPATILQRGSEQSNTYPLLFIEAEETANISISNLIVDGNRTGSETYAGTHGIQVSGNNTNVSFTNVIAKNALAAGLYVSGATVSLTNFHTENNRNGGVLLNKDEADNNPSLTVKDGCTFQEENQIWADSWNGTNTASVQLPAGW